MDSLIPGCICKCCGKRKGSNGRLLITCDCCDHDKCPVHSISHWDLRYLGLAKYVSRWSKDPSTKTGAAIVRPDRSLCSIGFNGFPKKMYDNPEWLANREEKYSRIVHCEINAELYTSEALTNYTLYTWPFASCDRCCVQMLQAGITRFVFPEPEEDKKERWQVAFVKTKSYIEQCDAIWIEVPRSRLHSAAKFVGDRLIPPLLHGDEKHQVWLKEELSKWIPDLEEFFI